LNLKRLLAAERAVVALGWRCELGVVARATKSRMAEFAAPSFQEASG
jgi:hypothetical protein